MSYVSHMHHEQRRVLNDPTLCRIIWLILSFSINLGLWTLWTAYQRWVKCMAEDL